MSTMLTPEVLREISQRFKDQVRPGRVRALLVAGSGLALEVPGWIETEVVEMASLFPFPMHQLPGHQHTILVWRRGGEALLVMNGRLHLYQGYEASEVVAPVRFAGLLGAEMMIATNASGAIDPEIDAGSLVVVSDHLNFLAANPLTGEWARAFGADFPDMTRAYDPELREIARDAARVAGFNVYEGVYAAMRGPSFETPAEIRMLGRLGATVVGMSTVPEVIAAVHMGLRVLVLSLAANPAAGIRPTPLSHEEVLEVGARSAGRMKSLVEDLVERLFPAA